MSQSTWITNVIFGVAIQICIVLWVSISIISGVHSYDQHSLLTAEHLKRDIKSSLTSSHARIPTSSTHSIFKQLDALAILSSWNINLSRHYTAIKHEIVLSLLWPAYKISRRQDISVINSWTIQTPNPTISRPVSDTTVNSSQDSQPISIQPQRICGMRISYPVNTSGSINELWLSQLLQLRWWDPNRDTLCLSVAAGISWYNGWATHHARIRSFLLQRINSQ